MMDKNQGEAGVQRKPTPGARAFSPKSLVLISVILGLPILLAFLATAIQGWGYVFDDSFITYRYAKNLAMGYGITWNPGFPPTEGYTNFLLVLVLAPVIKAGFDPLLATRMLSYLSAIVMAGILFAVARRQYNCSPVTSTMIAALILLVPETKNLCFVGLETVIYSCFLLVTFIMGITLIEHRQLKHSIIFSSLLFLTMLLRPEAALLYPVIFAAYLITSKHRNSITLKPLLAGLALLLALGGIYLTWKYLHFGELLPNPFYIKAAGQNIFSDAGTQSMKSFIGNNAPLLALVLPSVAVSLRSNQPAQQINKLFSLSGVGFLVIYCLFIAHIDTLMDTFGRFLYPLIPLAVLLAIPALAKVLGYLESAARYKTLLLAGTLIVFVLAFGSENILSVNKNIKWLTPNNKALTSDSIMQKEYRISKVLAQFPQISQVRIAFNDSGVIPYYSEAIWLDTVGLNDGFIARTRDKGKLVDYFFNWSPDLVIHPGKSEQSWVRNAHGPLGDFLSWANDPRWDEYEYVGTSKTNEARYDLQYFVKKSSRFRTSLEYFLRASVVDGWYDPFPLSIGTYNPGTRPLWFRRPS